MKHRNAFGFPGFVAEPILFRVRLFDFRWVQVEHRYASSGEPRGSARLAANPWIPVLLSAGPSRRSFGGKRYIAKKTITFSEKAISLINAHRYLLLAKSSRLFSVQIELSIQLTLLFININLRHAHLQMNLIEYFFNLQVYYIIMKLHKIKARM